MKKVVACFKKENKILGYCLDYGNSKIYEEQIDTSKFDTKNTKIIEVSNQLNNEPNSGFIDEILDNMPIGTSLKLKGDVEGMNDQQLIYVGKQKSDIVPIMYYYFYDGKAASGDFPSCFGYAGKQLRYESVFANWNENNKETVESLRNDYSFMVAVCEIM